MPGTVIAYKTTKDDQRIEAWWQSIEGSKAQALKTAILFYLDNYGRDSGDNGGNVQTDDPPGWVVNIVNSFHDAIAALPDAVSAGVLQALQTMPQTWPSPSVNSNGKRRAAPVLPPEPEPEYEEEPDPEVDPNLASATNAFLSMFG